MASCCASHEDQERDRRGARSVLEEAAAASSTRPFDGSPPICDRPARGRRRPRTPAHRRVSFDNARVARDDLDVIARAAHQAGDARRHATAALPDGESRKRRPARRPAHVAGGGVASRAVPCRQGCRPRCATGMRDIANAGVDPRTRLPHRHIAARKDDGLAGGRNAVDARVDRSQAGTEPARVGVSADGELLPSSTSSIDSDQRDSLRLRAARRHGDEVDAVDAASRPPCAIASHTLADGKRLPSTNVDRRGGEDADAVLKPSRPNGGIADDSAAHARATVRRSARTTEPGVP